MRAAISLVSSAAADLRWGDQPEVRVLPDGRLWLTDLQLSVSAADVYQAARGLVAAQLLGITEETGRPLAEVVGPWLVSLQTNEALLDLDLTQPADAARDDAA
nr:hypothetical protein [Modestobacter versicolor]